MEAIERYKRLSPTQFLFLMKHQFDKFVSGLTHEAVISHMEMLVKRYAVCPNIMLTDEAIELKKHLKEKINQWYQEVKEVDKIMEKK